ncbi:DUF177 domain-containing protein [Consotaella sp. CSK11QG-6]
MRCVPDESERAALANHLGIPAVERLEAELIAAPWRADGVRVQGRLAANVVQTCVVTLEPVHQTIDEPIEAFYVPADSRLARRIERDKEDLELDPEGDDGVEVFSGETIDLGNLLTEVLSLGLDPYPRAPRAAFEEVVDTDEQADDSPFASLKVLKPAGPDDRG